MEYISPKTTPSCWEEWNLRKGRWPLQIWKEIKHLQNPQPLDGCQNYSLEMKGFLLGF